MKKLICVLLAFCLLLALSACGKPAEPEVKDWTRQGYFQDESENILSVTWMDDVDEPGWYVGVMIGEIMAGSTLKQEGNALRGDLNAWDESAEPFVVTITEEGEDGLQLVVEGGETYHFKPMDMPEATIFVTYNAYFGGNISYAEGEETPEIDREYPFQSGQINLAEPETCTFLAWPQAGYTFVKWTKNDEDFSTEPQITVLLDESADFVAVFEEDPGWQNPVMNFVGEYQCDRAHALVECFGNEDALINIEWGGSAWEFARWTIIGRLDTDTLTVAYSGCTKAIVTAGADGESEEIEYDDGTGTIVFNHDGSFTWHEDQGDNGDMLFEWAPAGENEDPDYYTGVSSMEKSAVETLCAILRDAYLNEDWETIATYLRYPITINNTELKDEAAFLAFMQDKTVHESDREEMAAETCRDMFFNGQGICFGAGELWVIDLSYMTDDPPEFVIIGINGIVNK